MTKRIAKTQATRRERWEGKHRFEHWYVDNQVYFLTSRTSGGVGAFASDAAKQVFWERFRHYADAHGFTPFVTSLLPNHYHTMGYLKVGTALKPMMRGLHGSVAKLVNDLRVHRVRPFWNDNRCRDYFDGCIRDETQFRRAYQYILNQPVRHGVCTDWQGYPHTRVDVELERALGRSLELGAFLEGVPYARYQKRRG